MTNQLNLFNRVAASLGQEIVLNDDGLVVLYRHFFDLTESDNILNILVAELEWKQEYIRMYGKSIPIPRLTAWYGDADKSYSYSGINMNPLAWHPILLDIKNRIETVCDRLLDTSKILGRFYSWKSLKTRKICVLDELDRRLPEIANIFVMVSMKLNNALLIILGVAGVGVSMPFLSALFLASAIIYGFTGKFGNPKSRMVGYAALLADIFFIAAIGFGIFDWTMIGYAVILADIFFIAAIAWVSTVLDDDLASWRLSINEEEIE